VISMLAGDIFGDTPIRGRLLMFKAIYYGVTLIHWRENLSAYLLRKRNMKLPFTDPGPENG